MAAVLHAFAQVSPTHIVSAFELIWGQHLEGSHQTIVFMVQEMAVVNKSGVLKELVLGNSEVGGFPPALERIISGGPSDSEDYDVAWGDNTDLLPALIPLGYIFIGGLLTEISIMAICAGGVDISLCRICGILNVKANDIVNGHSIFRKSFTHLPLHFWRTEVNAFRFFANICVVGTVDTVRVVTLWAASQHFGLDPVVHLSKVATVFMHLHLCGRHDLEVDEVDVDGVYCCETVEYPVLSRAYPWVICFSSGWKIRMAINHPSSTFNHDWFSPCQRYTVGGLLSTVRAGLVDLT